MKYLVTGGAGFIGSHLTDMLLEKGEKVVVIDNLSTGKNNLSNQLSNSKLKFYQKDIRDNLTDIFNNEKPDIVIHLAANPNVQYSIQNPEETHDINVNGTVNLLGLSRKLGVKRFIFICSSAVYGDQTENIMFENLTPNPMSPYGLHKLIGEHYCKLYYFLYNLQTISLRLFNVFGPRQNTNSPYGAVIARFSSLISKNQQPTIYGDGEQTRDFVFVSDVADAIIKASETRNPECFGEHFNLGSGKSVSVNNMTHLLIKFSGKNIKPIYEQAMIETRHSLANISKISNHLAWTPKISFEYGLKKTYDYFAQQDMKQ